MVNDVLNMLGQLFSGAGDVIIIVFEKIITIFWNTESGITFWGIMFILLLAFTLIIKFLVWVLSWAGVHSEINNNMEDEEDEE